MEGSPGQPPQQQEQRPRRSRWEPPADSDLIGIPLVLGMVVALAAVIGAFWLEVWLGIVVLGVVLVAALAISYRVVSSTDIED